MIPQLQEKPNAGQLNAGQLNAGQLSSEVPSDISNNPLADPNTLESTKELREAAFRAFAVRRLKQEQDAADALTTARLTSAKMLLRSLTEVFQPFIQEVSVGWDVGLPDVTFPDADGYDPMRPALRLAGLNFTLIAKSSYTGPQKQLVIELACDNPECRNSGTWYSHEIKDFADVGAVLVGEHGAGDHDCYALIGEDD